MPGMNGMGPMGAGPRTGRGLGRCAPGGAEARGAVRGLGRGGLPWGRGRGFGGGRRRGRGAGYGLRRGYGAGVFGAGPVGETVGAESPVESLRAEAEALREDLAEVERRLAELGSEKQDEQE